MGLLVRRRARLSCGSAWGLTNGIFHGGLEAQIAVIQLVTVSK